MKLIVQPNDGVAPLIDAVKSAEKSIVVVVFRFDLTEFQKALEAAVGRGIPVHALVAQTNHGGERKLRKLENDLLAAGVTLDRTDNAMVRYHGKLLLVDRATLFVLGFNFTRRDIQCSRSFGVVIRNRALVQEAVRLIDADANRHSFKPTRTDLVVSPENARERLAGFIRKARQELLIYDPHISDNAMIKELKARARAGVKVKIIGKLQKASHHQELALRNSRQRLHVRAIVRDGRRAFVGSQSLRRLELDERREVGVIIRDLKVVKQIKRVFERDWSRK